MLSSVRYPPLKMSAITAAAVPNATAVALAEHSAAKVSFQRHQPGYPLHKIVDSAVSPLSPACHFGG